jgi:hypothetical protein
VPALVTGVAPALVGEPATVVPAPVVLVEPPATVVAGALVGVAAFDELEQPARAIAARSARAPTARRGDVTGVMAGSVGP